jgi:hypothetical protein
VTIFIVLPLREPKGEPRPKLADSKLAAIGKELQAFLKETWIAFTGSRGGDDRPRLRHPAAGSYALGLALQSNVAVELG